MFEGVVVYGGEAGQCNALSLCLQPGAEAVAFFPTSKGHGNSFQLVLPPTAKH